MALRRTEDVVTQAELRKDVEFSLQGTSAARLVSELYLNALARRVAAGAAVEPGALTFDLASKTVCVRKPPRSAPAIPRANSA